MMRDHFVLLLLFSGFIFCAVALALSAWLQPTNKELFASMAGAMGTMQGALLLLIKGPGGPKE